MPTGQRADIERQLKQLPASFTSAEITSMYRSLRADAERFKNDGVPQAVIEQRLHSRHKVLAFAYPTLFFRVVKGEMSEYMFTTAMQIKQRLDSGEITQEQAKDLVVDSAKRHIEGAAPRPSRLVNNGAGSASQEVLIHAHVDDNLEMKVVDK